MDVEVDVEKVRRRITPREMSSQHGGSSREKGYWMNLIGQEAHIAWCRRGQGSREARMCLGAQIDTMVHCF